MGVAKTRGCLPQRAETLHCRSMTTTHHTLHYRAMTTTHHTLHYRAMTTTHHTLHYRAMTTTHHTLHYRLSGQTQAQDSRCASRVVGSVPGLHATPYGVFINVGSFVLGVLLPYSHRIYVAGRVLYAQMCHRYTGDEERVFCYLTRTGFALLVMYCTHRCITVVLEMRKGCFTIRFLPVWV